MSEDEKRHPIQVVARRTGLSADVLRAWEKRYGVVAPARSDSGRRLYSDDDIELLRLLHRATTAGRSIGRVAELSRAELEALVREDAVEGPPPAAARAGDLPDLVEAAYERVTRLDGRGLHALLHRALVELPSTDFIERVMAPLLKRIGRAWEQKEIGPAHEHLASAVAQRLLSHLTATVELAEAAPHVVVATPAGARHELGAMLAGAVAAAGGWRVTYLGPDLPADDIAAAARQGGAHVVALSIVHPANDPAIGAELFALRTALPADVVMAIGGAAAPAYAGVAKQIGALTFTDLPGFRAALAHLAETAVA